MLSCGWEKEVLCKVDEAQGKFYHLDDAANSICGFQGHCGRKGELECHRGSHSPSWEAISRARFCLQLQIHAPRPCPALGPQGSSIWTNHQALFAPELLGFVCVCVCVLWELLAGIRGCLEQNESGPCLKATAPVKWPFPHRYPLQVWQLLPPCPSTLEVVMASHQCWPRGNGTVPMGHA